MRFILAFVLLNLSGCFVVKDIYQGSYENYMKKMNTYIGKNINNIDWYKSLKKSNIIHDYKRHSLDFFDYRFPFFFYGQEKSDNRFNYYNMAFIHLVASVNKMGMLDPIKKKCITTFRIRKIDNIVIDWKTKSNIKYCKRNTE